MKRPEDFEDYNIYFNEDGSIKANPFLSGEGGIGKEFKSWYLWSVRQNEIKYELMTDEEKTLHRKAIDHMRNKMRS